MHLTLTKRPAKLGSGINTRAEKHGDDDVPACDIPLAGIFLEREELNALLGDPSLHKALFTTMPGESTPQPVLRRFKPLQLADKFEGCTVTIIAGLSATSFMLDDVTIAKLKLEPQTGGLTAMSMQVQALAEDLDVTALLGWLNHDVDVEVQFGTVAKGKDKQQDLPLSTVGDNEEPEDRLTIDVEDEAA